MTKCPGSISSRRDPTAENATMALTPMCFNAAMLARPGTSVGVMVWAGPCREMKATRAPEGRDEMVMGDEGFPQGYTCQSLDFTGRERALTTYSFDLQGLAEQSAPLRLSFERKTTLLTHASSCQGDRDHYHRYIQSRLELMVSHRHLLRRCELTRCVRAHFCCSVRY